MRAKLALASAFVAGTLGSGSVVAQPSDAPIASNIEGALDVPEAWSCRKIEPEYREWLEDGNPAESWKYVGKTYRNVDTDELYNWQGWLDWVDDAGCLPAGLQTPSGVPTTGLIVAGAITALGVGLIAGGGGSGPKSPG